MRTRFKQALIFLIIINISFFVLCSCSEDDGTGYIFKTYISANPKNLDPQLATDESSTIVLGSMFRGLFKIDSNGALQCDTVKEYSVSEDGCTYTFILKDGIYWTGISKFSEPLTAYDYEFALKRIFNSDTNSPYKKTFKCIKNASLINKEIKKVDELGVKALNNETLQIVLEYPYFNFIHLLTLSASYPCNEKFFISTNGRYGLTEENCISNGSFYIKEWNYDQYWDNNYIIMKKNKLNSETDSIYPSGLNYFIKDDINILTDLSKESINCIEIPEYDKKIVDKFNNLKYQSKLSGLLINSESEYLKSNEIKKALSISIDRTKLMNQYPEGFSVANYILPDSVTILNKNVRDLIPDSEYTEYDEIKALSLWNNELYKNNLETVDNLSIIVNENYKCEDVIRNITEQWKQILNFNCNVDVISETEYHSRLNSKDYDIAVVDISCLGNDISDSFSFFTNGGSNNIYNYSNKEVDDAIYCLEKSKNLNEAVKYISNAEKAIISDSTFIPVSFSNSYFITITKATGIHFNYSTKQIDFTKAKMEE